MQKSNHDQSLMQPLVSIVITCYNDGPYLLEAVESAKAQEGIACEIIVVDDASDDEATKKVLQTIAQEDGIHVLFRNQNGGPSAARNDGIAMAKGSYILPLDGDDKIAPTYAKKAIELFQERQEVGIVYAQAEFFGEKRGRWPLPSYAFPDILAGNMIYASAFFKKSDWQKVGGYKVQMRHGNEDYEFWLSLLELGVGVYQIPEVLFYYRIKRSSRTQLLLDEVEKQVKTLVQIFHFHQPLYLKHIDALFRAIIHLRNEKNQEITSLHQRLREKDEEIVALHKLLYDRERRLCDMFEQLSDVGRQLAYAREVVALRDRQLEAARLKNRLKRFCKKMIGQSTKETWELPAEPQPKRAQTYRCRTPKLTEAIRQEIEHFAHKPLISIIMPVYNVDPAWLSKAVESVMAQWYEHWELCIVDDHSSNEATLAYLQTCNDPRIKVRFLEKNLNISGASNVALKMAKGAYVALMDNDDKLTPDALFEVVRSINEKGASLIYSDEDFIDTDEKCANPHFKPDFSPDLLLSHNYITHLAVIERSLVEEVGGFDARYDGAQDYDLFLKITEKTTKIAHIPKVLYHWRTLESSTSRNSGAKPEARERGKRALEAALRRRGVDGYVQNANLDHYYRVRYPIHGNPLVSIIIPFKDKPDLLRMSITSILEKTEYPHFEIIGISNNSHDPETFKMMRHLQERDQRITFYEYNIPFNYAQINNYAVKTYAKGEHVLLLNNDIEVISPDWLESMLEHSQREEIGCVGAKLYYPDDTIQHAGIIMGLGGFAGHSHKHLPRESVGYFNRLMVVQNVSAVTGACLMIKRDLYLQMGGMDAEVFKVAYNDVDFCLRVMKAGYWNLFTPYAQMYHHESITRGYETTIERQERFQKEKEALLERHRDILLHGDPFYNPNLCHDREDFSLCPADA